MSLQISAQGTKEGVLRKVSEYFPAPVDDKTPDKLPHGTDRAQLEAVRACIAAEIGAVDPKINGVRLVAEATAVPNGRSVMISVFPMDIHV